MRILSVPLTDPFNKTARCSIHKEKKVKGGNEVGCKLPHVQRHDGRALRFASAGTLCTDMSSFGALLSAVLVNGVTV